MSAEPGRPPVALLPLTPAQIRIAQKIADGKNTDTITKELSIAAGTITVQMQHCGQKLGVRGRAAIIHAGFVTEQLQRPDKVPFPGAFSPPEIETWRMVAIGATTKQISVRSSISRDRAQKRIRALRKRVNAANDPHLVTLGWAYDVLDESLVDMASGTVLRVPIRRWPAHAAVSVALGKLPTHR
ncbi:LuxR C-terminal-related transcriptional regulator [Streptomyces phaeochromogenes]|uniref:LuxR C-terminal-related transcriptional regulator n=1 Tax=Streptomyces phaeochromogenes TaxID=1923 RepID=A0ABZ1HA49_STRPH|nr:LuxR C-terminal-related transcriptional regulator [Streptomyces phaeochromogenes]WSD14447.1 LuxR C-terminal-related transcriptional regulator [Streptomyces phaeochromogenes]